MKSKKDVNLTFILFLPKLWEDKQMKRKKIIMYLILLIIFYFKTKLPLKN